MIRTNLSLDEGTRAVLNEESERLNLSVSALIRLWARQKKEERNASAIANGQKSWKRRGLYVRKDVAQLRSPVSTVGSEKNDA